VSAERLQSRRGKPTSFCPLIETGPLPITLYSTDLSLAFSLNFGQFDKLIASKLRSLAGKPKKPISNL